jgi:hypothetical protein
MKFRETDLDDIDEADPDEWLEEEDDLALLNNNAGIIQNTTDMCKDSKSILNEV